MAKFAAKDSNKNITLSPHGTGKVVVGTGATDATVQSDGNHNLVLQTGNATTGSITITDGANGDIQLAPNGTGDVNIVDPNSASQQSEQNLKIGRAEVMVSNQGVTSASAYGAGYTFKTNDHTGGGTFVTRNALVLEAKGDATVLGKISASEAQTDNININNNTISSTDTDGNIDLTPNGTGEVNISKVDIDSGTIDGVTIGTNSAVTDLRVDNLKLDANQISSTNTNGDIELAPNGTGDVNIIDPNSASQQSEQNFKIGRAEIMVSNQGTTSATAYGAGYTFKTNDYDGSSFSTPSALIVGANGDASILGDMKFNSGYGSVATGYGCRAWVNFKGTGTVAIDGSGNVSSITDSGSGNYDVNFTTAMPDDNYAGCVTLQRENASANIANVYGSYSNDTWSTTSFKIRSMYVTGSVTGYTDSERVSVAVFR